MALSTVTLTWDLADLIQSGVNATITLVPTAVLTDTTDHIVIPQVTRSRVFTGGTGSLPGIIACDNSHITPAGWAYTITVTLASGQVLLSFAAFINFANGSTQDLSALTPLTSVTAWVPAVGAPLFSAAPPTGATATDTASIAAAITRMTAAGGNGTLQLQDGTYQVDSNSLVIRSCSNFAVKGTGNTVIAQAPNTAGKPNNTGGNILTIADCTDFRVDTLTLDGLRDTIAPVTALSASASSGQPSVTVAAGQGSRYQPGQALALFGGIGTGDYNNSDGYAGSGGGGLTIQSITLGGGSGGGDLITFTGNIGHNYTQISASLLSDGFGPYGGSGAYLTPYQTSTGKSVAGRTLGGEDQQNALHLINCQRFTVSRVTARNIWESGIKLGTGFEAANASLTDGCSQGAVTDCTCYHGYDQGVSVWVSDHITVKGCVANASGWGGVVLTASDNCAVIGNQCLNSVYVIPPGPGCGSGVVIEGGVGNQVKGNIVTGVNQFGVQAINSPLYWGLTAGGSAPTLAVFESMGTVAGTSIQVSASAPLIQGGLYSIIDGPRTEAVTIASIVDGTHVTFTVALAFAHASGTPIGVRVAQENVIEGNTITAAASSGVYLTPSVRNTVRDNRITGWGLGGTGPVPTFHGHGIETQYFTGTYLPAGTSLGGEACTIEGNIIGEGNGVGIYANGVGNLLISGNRIYSPGSPSVHAGAVELHGVADSAVTGNWITDVFSSFGITLQSGGPSNATCSRITIADNVVRRISVHEGINVQTADSLTITGNVVQSCGGNAGIYLTGTTNSVIAGNVCNGNAGAGIELTDNAAVHSLYNQVTGNVTRDDGSGINTTTGAAQTQQHGIVEAGSSNFNVFTGNESDSNALDQLTTVGAGTLAFGNIISDAIASPPQLAVIDATAADITAPGAQAAGATGKLADAGHVHPANYWVPADNGLLTAVCDPFVMSSATTSLMTAGTLYLIKLPIRQAMTISSTWWLLSVNASGASTGTFTGLYNSSGTLLSGSSDVASNFTGGAIKAAQCNLTTPQALAAGTFVWAALLVNFASTQPTLFRAGSGATSNTGLAAATFRFAANGTSITSLPGSITPASNTTAGAQPWWTAGS